MSDQILDLTTRERPEVLEQDGRTYHGTPNTNKESAVPMIYFNERDRQVCSAKRANGTRICVSPFVMPNGRCKKHGGKSLQGVAHPDFKTGRFSRNLPSRLQDRYAEALEDTKLHEFHDDLALIETRLDDLMRQMDEGGGRDIIKEIKEAHQSFKWAVRDGDRKAQREAQNRLDDAIKRAGTEVYLWAEVRELTEQRRKIILAQAKHMQLTNKMIPVDKANLIVAALMDAVRRHVTDRNVLNAIVNEFQVIAQGGTKRNVKGQLNP